jgi:hypothetical protein
LQGGRVRFEPDRLCEHVRQSSYREDLTPAAALKKEVAMKVLHRRCAGLDVHTAVVRV